MSSKTANTNTRAKKPVSKNGSRSTKKSLPDKLKPGFKVDRSKTARSISKVYAMTHERLWGKEAMEKKRQEDIAYLENQIAQTKSNIGFLQKSLDEATEKQEHLERILEHLKATTYS